MKAFEVVAALILLSGLLFVVNGPVRSRYEGRPTPDAQPLADPGPPRHRDGPLKDEDVNPERAPKDAGHVLAFSAKWCGPCKSMKPVIASIKRRGYHVMEVDIDTPDGQVLVRKYNVTQVPTYIFLKPNAKTFGGEEYHRQTGALNEEAFCRILRGIGFVIRAVIKLVF